MLQYNVLQSLKKNGEGAQSHNVVSKVFFLVTYFPLSAHSPKDSCVY